MILRALFFILIGTAVVADINEADSIKIIDWLTENSKYEYNGEELPDVVFETIPDMCKVLYPNGVPDPCEIAGYYNNDTNTIYIADTPTTHMVEEGYKEAVLVHELVHFLQWINGEYDKVACRQELEKDAFKLQDQYIDEYGLPEENQNDPLFALLVSNCPELLWPTPGLTPGGG